MKEQWAARLEQRMTGFEVPVDETLRDKIIPPAKATRFPWWLVVAVSSVAVACLVVYLGLHPRAETPSSPIAVMEEPFPEEVPAVDCCKDTLPVVPRLPLVRWANETIPEEESVDISLPLAIPNISDTLVSVPEIEPETAILPEEDYWQEDLFTVPSPKLHRVAVSTAILGRTSPFSSGVVPKNQGSSQYTSPHTDTPGSPLPNDNPPEGQQPPLGNSGENPDTNDEDETKANIPPLQRSEAAQNSQTEEPWNHAFPIQVSARITFSWSRNWGIETGVSYLHFNSWQGGYRQRMEYLGIPVYARYTFQEARAYSFYTTTGVQAFKCVGGNAPDRPWLFSFGAGVGAEWRLSPSIGLYAETGLDGHYHTGISHNYYTENPLSLSFSLGIRLRLVH